MMLDTCHVTAMFSYSKLVFLVSYFAVLGSSLQRSTAIEPAFAANT
jgi:hypothetical protein